MQLPALLGLIGTLVGLAVVAGAVFAVAKANYARATVEALRSDIGDYLKRIDYLERQAVRQSAEIHSLQSENATLARVVTSKADIEAVRESLAKHEHQVLSALAEISKSIKELAR